MRKQGVAKFVMIRVWLKTEICKKASKTDGFQFGGKSNCGERVLGGRPKRQQKHPRFIDWGKTRPSQRIDEFDAFLHYESAPAIVRTLNRSRTFQTILTTHNTSLVNNDRTRPDCCYVMSYEGGVAGRGAPIRIKSLAEATPQKIRKSTTGKSCTGTERSMAARPKMQQKCELVRATARMPVPCTSPFLPVDYYFGNKDGAFADGKPDAPVCAFPG